MLAEVTPGETIRVYLDGRPFYQFHMMETPERVDDRRAPLLRASCAAGGPATSLSLGSRLSSGQGSLEAVLDGEPHLIARLSFLSDSLHIRLHRWPVPMKPDTSVTSFFLPKD